MAISQGLLALTLDLDYPDIVMFEWPSCTVPVGLVRGAFAAERLRMIPESGRLITALPIDMLKAHFPADLRHERDDGRMLDLCRDPGEASSAP